jgi:hypothetical protein
VSRPKGSTGTAMGRPRRRPRGTPPHRQRVTRKQTAMYERLCRALGRDPDEARPRTRRQMGYEIEALAREIRAKRNGNTPAPGASRAAETRRQEVAAKRRATSEALRRRQETRRAQRARYGTSEEPPPNNGQLEELRRLSDVTGRQMVMPRSEQAAANRIIELRRVEEWQQTHHHV